MLTNLEVQQEYQKLKKYDPYFSINMNFLSLNNTMTGYLKKFVGATGFTMRSMYKRFYILDFYKFVLVVKINQDNKKDPKYIKF